MGKLSGKVGLITGAASGMGKASAELWASEGAKMAIVDVQDEKGEEVVNGIKSRGGEAMFVHTDVTKVAEIEKMINTTVEKYGRLDFFWHNAGNAGPGLVERTSEEEYDFTLSLHIKAGFFGAKFAIEEMKKIGGGAILFTSSLAGLKASRSSTVYSICKSSLVMMTKCLALHYGQYNIRTNCICPGAVNTPLWPSFMGRDSDKNDAKAVEDAYIAKTPLHRFGQPEDIAKASLFLVSDEASYVNGAILTVDGGISCS
ncbi:MAG: glucose 1-dehydrogenase [Synergistaceae bacterium]|jgi:NAD(P)-dependent dehydrogenase (short-subunit alcohol dehydrogenase family)|nr:glucose 1-dehydrogenase [Synergistaceae bacterium]